MKKSIILLFLLFFNSSVFAAGTYDGIWNGLFVGYFSIHENNGSVIIARLAGEGNGWEAYQGTRTGNKMTIETIIGGVSVKFDITFNSNTEFTAEQKSCKVVVDGYTCLMSNGQTFKGNKIF